MPGPMFEAFAAVSALPMIRERTRPLHSELESAMDLNQHLGSLAPYRELLRRYLSIYLPFEELLGRQTGKVQGLIASVYRSKVTLLERDLGVTAGAAAIPFPVAMPVLDNLDALLGALYVVEGSALGGQYLYREVERRLGLDADTGAAFFHGDGEATGSRWKRFTSVLEEQVSDPERAADAAAAMFGIFRKGLTAEGGGDE